jgi:hypothetical protein
VSYRIIDEPGPSTLEKLATNPFWPFFAAMFAGAWLAWPWFVVNSFALGSSRRSGDLGLVALGIAINVVLVLVLGQLRVSGVLGEASFAYALLVPQAARLIVLYLLYMRQERTFQLFEHFGGVGKNGLLLVIAGGFLRNKVLASAPGLWVLLLA